MKKHALAVLALLMIGFSNNIYASSIENNNQAPITEEKADMKNAGENISVADSDPEDIKKNVDLSDVPDVDPNAPRMRSLGLDKQFLYSSQSGNIMYLYNYETLEQSTYMIGWGYLMEYLGVNAKDSSYYDVRFQGSIHAIHNSDAEKFISLSQIKSFPHYVNENGRVNHYIEGNPLNENSWAFNSDLGDAPSWMVPNKKYYSFSGIYFTESPEQLGQYSQQTYAVNKDEPYYDYYLYQPLRTRTSYSAAELDQAFNYFYNNSWTVGQPTIMQGKGWKFLDAENKYGTNALMVLSLGIHEGAYGTSAISINKNNPFGYAAYDSNTGEAKRFNSIDEAIDYVSGDYLSWVHSDPTSGSNYFGNHFGNKGSGINIKYASDPLWGEKNANIYAKIDRYLGKKDYQKYGLSIVRQGAFVYWQKGTDYAFAYRTSKSPLTYMYPVVTYNNETWTQVGMEPPFDANRNIDYYGRYNWDFGYINQNDLLKINSPKSEQTPPTPEPIPDPIKTEGNFTYYLTADNVIKYAVEKNNDIIVNYYEYYPNTQYNDTKNTHVQMIYEMDADQFIKLGTQKEDGTGNPLTYYEYNPATKYDGNQQSHIKSTHTVGQKYMVVYHANGADSGTTPVMGVYEDAEAVTVSDNVNHLGKYGYSFIGWNTQANGQGINYLPGENRFNMPREEVALYAQWEAIKDIPVTFDLNYADPINTIVGTKVQFDTAYGNAIASAPIRIGYEFRGWYDAPTAGNKIDTTTVVKNPVAHTIYAKWEATKDILVDFTLNYPGVTDTITGITVEFDATYGTTSNGTFPENPTRFGYVFTGWYDAKTGGNKIDATSKVTTVDAHTLYAQWEVRNNIAVTFDLNYADAIATPNKIEVAFNKQYGIPSKGTFPENPTRFGYEFIGWYDAAIAGIEIDNATIVTTPNAHTIYAQWKVVKDIPVDFNLNYPDTTNTITGITVEFDATYGTTSTGIFPENPTRFGYVFAGWYDANTGGNKIDVTSKVTTVNAHTLYAQWEVRNNIAVTFDLNYADAIEIPNKIEVAFNKQYGIPSKGIFPENPTRFGYEFIGWYDASTMGNKIDNTVLVTNPEAHTIYAQWEVKKDILVNFDFNYNGSTIITDTLTVTYDEAYGTNFPIIPTRVGYVFIGWYDAITGGNKIDATSKVTSIDTHTLYAHWDVKRDIKINFDVNYTDNTISIMPIEVAINGTYGQPTAGLFPENPEQYGYEFVGWYNAAIGGDKIEGLSLVINDTAHTLYAQWQAKKDILVSFDLNYENATNTSTPMQVEFNKTYGETNNSSLLQPNRYGYEFVGWYDAKTAGNKVVADTIVAKANNHTLYAQWEVKKDIIVNFNLNYTNAIDTPTSIQVEFNQPYDNTVTPTRTGYEFMGWYDAPTGGNKVGGQTLVTTVDNHTLYAQWKAIDNIKVTFNTQQRDIIENTTLLLTYDNTYGATGMFPENPTSIEYIFTGWYDAKNGGNQVDKNTMVSQTTDHILYAQWLKKPPVLKPNVNTIYSGTNHIVCGQGTPGQIIVLTLPNGIDTLETVVPINKEWCISVNQELFVDDIIAVKQQDEVGRTSAETVVKVIKQPLYEIIISNDTLDIDQFNKASDKGILAEYIIDTVGAKIISTETGTEIADAVMYVNVSEYIEIREGMQIQVELSYDATSTGISTRTLRTTADDSVSRTITLTLVKSVIDTEDTTAEEQTTIAASKVVLPKTGENSIEIMIIISMFMGVSLIALIKSRKSLKE